MSESSYFNSILSRPSYEADADWIHGCIILPRKDYSSRKITPPERLLLQKDYSSTKSTPTQSQLLLRPYQTKPPFSSPSIEKVPRRIHHVLSHDPRLFERCKSPRIAWTTGLADAPWVDYQFDPEGGELFERVVWRTTVQYHIGEYLSGITVRQVIGQTSHD